MRKPIADLMYSHLVDFEDEYFIAKKKADSCNSFVGTEKGPNVSYLAPKTELSFSALQCTLLVVH